jgi:hypothetical protein
MEGLTFPFWATVALACYGVGLLAFAAWTGPRIFFWGVVAELVLFGPALYWMTP